MTNFKYSKNSAGDYTVEAGEFTFSVRKDMQSKWHAAAFVDGKIDFEYGTTRYNACRSMLANLKRRY